MTSPIRTFISVDLPAPFSPRMPWMRPARRVRSTSSHATTAPKRLVMPFSSTAGGETMISSPPVSCRCWDKVSVRRPCGSALGEGLGRDLGELGLELARCDLLVDIVHGGLFLGRGVADDRTRLGIDADLEQLRLSFLELARGDLFHGRSHVVAAIELDGDVVVELLGRLADLRRAGAHRDQARLVGSLHDRAMGSAEV